MFCVADSLSLCRPQRPAFSKDDLLPMDLGTFYREFQNPPQLASLSLHISSQSMADDLVRHRLFSLLLKPVFFCLVRFRSLLTVIYVFPSQDSLPEKLAVYEKNIDEFDAFVDMLQ